MGHHKIAIVTDSSACIPEDALEGLDVFVIPVWLIWDGQRFRDGVDMDSATFYKRLGGSKTLPTSSQPSPGEFKNFFQGVAADFDTVVCVLVSSKISGTIASAEATKAEVPGLTIRIVDSLSSSMGLGMMVLAAARAAADGKTVDEVVAAAESMKDRTNLLFVVDTLEYLHRGGRIGGSKRLLGTALGIKPILEFNDGQIEPLSQARTMGKALTQMLKLVEERAGGKAIVEAAAIDIDAPEEGDMLAKILVEEFGTPVVYRSTVSPVVGTHVGPGTVGIAFYTEL